MEMPMNETTDRLMKAQSTMFATAIKIGAAAVANQGRIAKHQMACFDKWMDVSAKQADIMKGASDPQDMLTKTAEVATDFSQDMATMMREGVELSVELGTAMTSTINEELKASMATVSETAVAS